MSAFPQSAGYYKTCWKCGDLGMQFFGSGMTFTFPCKCFKEEALKAKAQTDSDLENSYAGL